MNRQEAIAKAMSMDPPAMVAEFHKTFQHPSYPSPQWPDKETQVLRYNLIQEELKEYFQACADGNYVEAADALGDLLYVVLGAFEAFGLGNNVGHQVMATIHASNMSKLFGSIEEAQKFVDDTTTEQGPQYEYSELEDGRVVMYHAQGPKKGKVVKGPDYSKPDLSFLNEYVK